MNACHCATLGQKHCPAHAIRFSIVTADGSTYTRKVYTQREHVKAALARLHHWDDTIRNYVRVRDVAKREGWRINEYSASGVKIWTIEEFYGS